MSLKIAISGISGKVGKVLHAEIISNPGGYHFVGGLSSQSSIADYTNLSQIAEVIIDFSSPAGLTNLVNAATTSKAKLVIGTTGLTEEHFSMLREAGKIIPVIYAANMSPGLNLLTFLATRAAQTLTNYDIEIIEAHHRHKLDVPSGSALQIGKEIAAILERDFTSQAVVGRHQNGLRGESEIGISSIRAGGIYGDHTVIFAGESEVVKIEHQALGREVFAQGALAAARWLVSRPPALYSMRDVLGLE